MPFKDYVFDGVCFTINATLAYTGYALFKATKEFLNVLKETPEVEISSQLIADLAEKSGEGIVACVKGSVRALESPLTSAAKPNISGVIWKHTIKEHIVAQIMGIWMNEERTVDTSYSYIPFLLMNKGIGVHVSDPSNLEEVDLKIVSEKFEAANNSLADHLWGWMKGVRSTGTQQTEEMLVEGTHVLGIGRLLLKDDALHLECSTSLPYIITTKDKKSLLELRSAPLPLLKVITFVFAGAASYYSYRIIKRFYDNWKRDRKRKEEARQILEARIYRETHEVDLPENIMCVICCGLRDVLLLPCNHVCVCGECALKLNPRICPVCRTSIESIQPVYFS